MKKAVAAVLSVMLCFAVLCSQGIYQARTVSEYEEKAIAFIHDPRWANGTSWNGSQRSKIAPGSGVGCFAYASDFVKYVHNRNYVVDGTKYTVLVTSGDFIPGDSVDIYRDEAHTNELRIGRGSVSRQNPTAVTASGAIVRIAVKDGDEVKKGDLLLETAEGSFDGYKAESTVVTAPDTPSFIINQAAAGWPPVADGVIAEKYRSAAA